ncbi:hypothetical protein [Clostridium estertheticum]|nr:hypothetical protein [Clostridium estertheticum]MBU3186601.1 hypothetical protein [Clostridium estertheticum]
MKINKKVKGIIIMGAVALSINIGVGLATTSLTSMKVATPIVTMIDPPG